MVDAIMATVMMLQGLPALDNPRIDPERLDALITGSVVLFFVS